MKFSKTNLKEYIKTQFELELLNAEKLTQENLKEYIAKSFKLNRKLLYK